MQADRAARRTAPDTALTSRSSVGIPVAWTEICGSGSVSGFSYDGYLIVAATVASLSMAAGLVTERWLFFAEAEHVSMLYYGADAA